MQQRNIYEVSQVNSYIKGLISADAALGNILIRGELSNYKIYPSGHHYFTLKDSNATLKCVMFRSSASKLRFRPESGMKVVAGGSISVYERDGVYQLYCRSMTPEGTGDLTVAFEQMKRKLHAEGLFDQKYKKPIPKFPRKIAVITSSAGAAVHDILRILGRRFPLASVVIVPVRVQGKEAPEEIAEAIALVNHMQLADVIITGRGGGSLEDLWAFNEEIVARAIFSSAIPVISAVGHEPDIAISDYVADLRAATPSNAAELVVPDKRELLEDLGKMEDRMIGAVGKRIQRAEEQLRACTSAAVLQSPDRYIKNREEQLQNLKRRISFALQGRLESELLKLGLRKNALASSWRQCDDRRRQHLAVNITKLDAMSPLKVLMRGYGIVRNGQDRVVRSVAAVSEGDPIQIILHDGVIDAGVTGIKKSNE